MINKSLDLIRGSLIGGAAGDALGYTVEFDSYKEIVRTYGPAGITSYELQDGYALVSDDTQMTLFTANGLLMGLTRRYMRGIGRAPQFYVQYAYQDWYHTQHSSFDSRMKDDNYRYTWLSAIPELYALRAPGNTCLSAISDMIQGKTPQNNSKGCGGVMRIAPWPLFCAAHDVRYTTEQIDVAGGEIARITHKHPLGWMPAIVLTHIIYRLVKDTPLNGLQGDVAREVFASIVKEAIGVLPSLKVAEPVSALTWDGDKTLDEAFHNDVERQTELLERALLLAERQEGCDVVNIMKLGEGWVGEEALAIAVYAVTRHIDSFADVLIAAVNHDGDSDSTGAVAGNIMGAITGYDAIPVKFKQNLELKDIILTIADDLHQGCIISESAERNTPEKQQWHERYWEMRPKD